MSAYIRIIDSYHYVTSSQANPQQQSAAAAAGYANAAAAAAAAQGTPQTIFYVSTFIFYVPFPS